MELRDYQKQAIEKILWAQSLPGNDLCVLPTGAGKSVVIADLAKQLNQDILIIQPGKEILEQNYGKLTHYIDPEEIGIYSASMESKVIKKYTFATIQSIYTKPEFFKHFKTVIIDECHLVNPKNLDGMFTSFLKAIGNPKVIGFTATPYRLSQSYKYDPVNGWGEKKLVQVTITKLINRLREKFWNRLIFNINNHELVEKNYLVPLEYIDKSIIDQADIPVNISGSDYNMDEFEKIIEPKQQKIMDAIIWAKENSKGVLVFCSSVKQAEYLSSKFQSSHVVTSKTHKKLRDFIINGFKQGNIKIVFNMGVLTTGFDHPGLDAIVLLRPTQSISLYYQMLGRGVRLAEGKTHCKVIDLTGTVKRMGRIETIKVEKIGSMWELISEKGSWHNKELYSRVIGKK